MLPGLEERRGKKQQQRGAVPGRGNAVGSNRRTVRMTDFVLDIAVHHTTAEIDGESKHGTGGRKDDRLLPAARGPKRHGRENNRSGKLLLSLPEDEPLVSCDQSERRCGRPRDDDGR